MNIPNAISAGRILLVPAFVMCFFLGGEHRLYMSSAIFLIAGISDIIDGRIARKYDIITPLGKILDPVADKLMQCAVVLCLYIDGIVPIFILVIYFAKEIVLLTWGLVVIRSGRMVQGSKWYGKVGTVLIYAVMIPAILFPQMDKRITLGLISLAIGWGIVCLALYFRDRKGQSYPDPIRGKRR